MNDEGVDTSRRHFLTAVTTAIGAVGTGFVAVPFLSAMQPSAKTQALGAPVEIDLSKLELGQRIIVAWRGKPVWILKRNQETLDTLVNRTEHLQDPDSDESIQPAAAKNETRALKPEIFVAIGICTHLGCSPIFRPEIAPADLGEDWKGGFFCPCHGSGFDLAGRVFKGVPAPTNLEIPPYRYLSDTRLVVGEKAEEVA